MNADPNNGRDEGFEGAYADGGFRRWWRKLGGGSLMIAALLHLGLLLFGVFWVLRVIREVPADDGFLSGGKGGGGGERTAASQVETKKRAAITPTNKARRVFAEGAVSSYAVPDPGDSYGEMSVLSSLTGGGSKGLGGTGRGGGFGDGTGRGIGPGNGDGNGGLKGAGITPFGMADPSADGLEGVFYDLKQTRDRTETGISNDKTKDVIRDFVMRGWNETSLDRYYKAKRTLYQTKVYIPVMKAEGAPAAFGCAAEVQPSRWMVIYRGMVTPPKSGKYRFVGAGDDVLVVRFNGRHVLDHGFTSGTTGVHISQHVPFFRGEAKDDELKKRMRRDYPMHIPVTYYQYPTTKNWNSQIGGLAVGAEFEVQGGRAYPIEILISEIPGGLFCASLMIEEVERSGGRKDAAQPPVLPLFRLDNSLPEVDGKADNAPPLDPSGPVWKKARGRVGAYTL